MGHDNLHQDHLDDLRRDKGVRLKTQMNKMTDDQWGIYAETLDDIKSKRQHLISTKQVLDSIERLFNRLDRAVKGKTTEDD